MSPTTSSVAQNLFTLKTNLLILLTFRIYPHFFKYYNILKHKKDYEIHSLLTGGEGGIRTLAPV